MTSTFNDSDRVLLVNKSEGEMTVTIKRNKKLSWCLQTRPTRLEVSQGHQT